MADVRQRTTAGNLFRSTVRFLGLTGAFLGFCGFCYLFTLTNLPFGTLNEFLGNLRSGNVQTWGLVAGASLAVWLGAALVAVWLIVELLTVIATVTGQRAAVGGNVYAQIGLAIALVVIVNAVAFHNYRRFDCTRTGEFTLPPDLVKELQTLRDDSPTDVIVLRRHKTAIAGGAKRDDVDSAAEEKIVEKVNDLVDQLRELGPRFQVTVLDTEARNYFKQVDEMPAVVRDAVESAPEDSIFFHANGRVRRMSFSDFYRLDKTLSIEKVKTVRADGGEREYPRSVNLVLIPQGKEKFIRRVLGVEERKPRIGLVAIHPELSTRETSDELSSAGLRKSLEANGFEVVDILVKKWGRGGPQPAALTYEEYELDRLESRFNLYSLMVQDREIAVKQFGEMEKQAKTMSLPELDRRFRRAAGRAINTESDREFILEVLKQNIALRTQELGEFQRELAEIEPKFKAMQTNEKASEGRRVSDMPAKLKAAVNDCDLLIVPRLTSMDLAKGYVLRPTFFTMPKDQSDVIRDFLKSGKPVLACFGPNKFGAGMEAESDDLEKVFARLGIEFGNQAVLTDKEARAAAERQGDGLGSASDLPPLVFDFPATGKPNPVGAAFLTSARSVAGKLDINKSGPRPIWVNERVAKKLPYASVIVQSVKESWNEEKPIPDEDYIPKFEATKLDDPKKGTPDEERRGPFPIGVAIETKVPAEWFDESLEAARTASSIGAAAGGLGLAATSLILEPENFATTSLKQPTVRIAAFGHGGLFTGKELNPAQEQLLLHTVNWQLRRDDVLPQNLSDAEKWRFPRVALTPERQSLWQSGMRFVLPAFCLYLGTLVFLSRKLR